MESWDGAGGCGGRAASCCAALSGAAHPRARSAARASFTATGGGLMPAAANSRAPGVCRAGGACSRKPRGSASIVTAPSSSAITRSAAARQRSSRCSASTTAVPHSSLTRRRTPRSSSPATGSSWDVGSSSSSSRGRPASAAPSATRWSSPPDSSCVERSSRPATPSASAASSTPRATAASLQPRFSSGNASSARTVPITTCVSGSWNSEPATADSSAGPCSCESRPPATSRPTNSPPWKCGTSPAAARSSVDLPEPEPPARTTNSPGSTRSETSASAGRPASGYV